MTSDVDGETTELSRPARRQAEIAAYVVEHGSVSASDLGTLRSRIQDAINSKGLVP